MDKLQLVLFVFAFVCFVIAGWQAAEPHYHRLVAIGLAFFAAAFVFGGALHIFAQ
jgi:hypothetical protein